MGLDTVDEGTPAYYHILLKLDTDGNYVWNDHFSESESEWLHTIRVDVDNNIYILGEIYGAYLT
jgi:hypothetical protein